MSELRRFDPSALKILIVGDNAFERRVVMDVLIALGVKEIFSADDAVAAFAQIMLKKPDMVVADAEMRPFSGFMLVKEIRNTPMAQRHVPIVLFTHESSPEFADIARNAGANEILAKPISASQMRKCLEDAATRPKTFAEPKAYRGPERRDDGAGRPAGIRRRESDFAAANGGQGGLDRASRAQVLASIDEARTQILRWANTGDSALISAARAALERASETAWSGGADEALTRALASSIRLTEAAKSGHADPHVLDVSLTAARAVLSAGGGRNAMRQALAEAMTEVANMRDAG